MRKSVITILSTITVAVGALGTVGVAIAGPAQATAAPKTVIVTLCEAVPGLKTGLATELDKATKSLATATTTLTAKRAAMTTAISTYGTSIINYLKTADAGGNTTAAADVLRGHQSQFVDSVLAWNSARLAASDGDRDLNLVQLRTSFVESVETAGCAVA